MKTNSACKVKVSLTGRTSWKASLSGKILVIVEEERQTNASDGAVKIQTLWREATVDDMQRLSELRSQMPGIDRCPNCSPCPD